jgi:anti-sigma B factor antagonist
VRKRDLKITARTVNGVLILDMQGTYYFPDDYVLADTVKKHLDRGQGRILLNLEQVDWMSSTGIGDLVSCIKRTAEKGGSLKLLNPSERVHDLLVMTRLAEVFEIFEDEDEALESFAPGGPEKPRLE